LGASSSRSNAALAAAKNNKTARIKHGTSPHCGNQTRGERGQGGDGTGERTGGVREGGDRDGGAAVEHERREHRREEQQQDRAPAPPPPPQHGLRRQCRRANRRHAPPPRGRDGEEGREGRRGRSLSGGGRRLFWGGGGVLDATGFGRRLARPRISGVWRGQGSRAIGGAAHAMPSRRRTRAR
jgi:hypothetical protein